MTGLEGHKSPRPKPRHTVKRVNFPLEEILFGQAAECSDAAAQQRRSSAESRRSARPTTASGVSIDVTE